MKAGLKQISIVSTDVLKDCFAIVDQVHPYDAIALFHKMRDDVERRGHVLFVFNGAHNTMGFIKGQINKPNFKSITPYGYQAQIDSLYVDKKYQNSGIGRMLVQAYENYCKSQNVAEIILRALPTEQAKKFCEKNGYKLVNNTAVMRKYLVR